MHTIGADLADHSASVHPFFRSRRNQPGHILPHPGPRLSPPEPARDPLVHPIQSRRPAKRLYVPGSGRSRSCSGRPSMGGDCEGRGCDGQREVRSRERDVMEYAGAHVGSESPGEEQGEPDRGGNPERPHA